MFTSDIWSSLLSISNSFQHSVETFKRLRIQHYTMKVKDEYFHIAMVDSI